MIYKNMFIVRRLGQELLLWEMHQVLGLFIRVLLIKGCFMCLEDSMA